MPRVKPLCEEAKIKDFKLKMIRELKHTLSDNGISYTRIAKSINITPQAVAHQFKTNSVSMEVWAAAQVLLREERENA